MYEEKLSSLSLMPPLPKKPKNNNTRIVQHEFCSFPIPILRLCSTKRFLMVSFLIYFIWIFIDRAGFHGIASILNYIISHIS